MAILNPTLNDLFRRIEEEAHLRLSISPIPLTITTENSSCEGWYAFFGRGAVRLETASNEIVGVSVWTTPKSLNKPELHLDLTKIDVYGEIDTIVKMMHGAGAALVRSDSMFEETASDIDTFMLSIGPMAYSKKASVLYQSYVPWAEVNNKKAIQPAYFIDLAKAWLIRHGKGAYANIRVERGTKNEKTVVNSSQETEFTKNITHNEIYHKAKILDRALRNLAQNDPLINGIFICGAPGEDKTDFVRSIFQSEKVWDTQVVYKTNVLGFAALLQILWEYRKGKIIIIDQSDRILKYKSKKPFSIAYRLLMKALNTEERYRAISYSREDENEE